MPLTRFIDAHAHPELLANGILFTRTRARELVERYLATLSCGAGCGCGPVPQALGGGVGAPGGGGPPDGAGGAVTAAAAEFFGRALAERLSTADVFRVTITSFLDAYNFDLRRLMKCCVHHVLPSGHIVPFCAYNVLYRDGQAPLPPLRE